METALSVINSLPSTYDQIAVFVRKVKDEALSGEYNPLEVLVQLRAVQKALEILNQDDELDQAAQREFDKFGQKTVDFNGVKITSQETGVKYDFKQCNDVVWNDYKVNEESYSIQRKARETFLKSLTAPTTIVDEETGDTMKVNPPSKTSKTKLAVTLK